MANQPVLYFSKKIPYHNIIETVLSIQSLWQYFMATISVLMILNSMVLNPPVLCSDNLVYFREIGRKINTSLDLLKTFQQTTIWVRVYPVHHTHPANLFCCRFREAVIEVLFYLIMCTNQTLIQLPPPMPMNEQSQVNIALDFWDNHPPCAETRGWFNIKMPSYQYRKSHCGDKTILRPSYLHNEISYNGKMTSLYWIRPQIILQKLGQYHVCWCLCSLCLQIIIRLGIANVA